MSTHPPSGPVDDLFARHGFDAAALLEVLGDLPSGTVVGLEPTDDELAVHAGPIPDDHRGAVAGLFGLVVPPEWHAVAVGLDGWAEEHGAADDEPDVHIRALLTRSGQLSTRVQHRSEEADLAMSVPDSTADEAPGGLLVDALHRMLDLDAPGAPPDPVDVALRTWAQSILLGHLGRGGLSWTDAVLLHPGSPRAATTGSAGSVAAARITPSIETLIEATFRSADDWDWGRVHRRARTGSMPGDLDPDEAAWMDTTMYARWLTSHLADPLGVASLLDGAGSTEVCAGLRAVVAGVDERRATAPAA